MQADLLNIYANAKRHKNDIKEKIIINFVDGAFCEILGQSESDYRIDFLENDVVLHSDTIKINHWVCISIIIITARKDKVAENVASGTDINMYYWIDIPSQRAGTYTSTIYIKAVETGISP